MFLGGGGGVGGGVGAAGCCVRSVVGGFEGGGEDRKEDEEIEGKEKKYNSNYIMGKLKPKRGKECVCSFPPQLFPKQTKKKKLHISEKEEKTPPLHNTHPRKMEKKNHILITLPQVRQ